MKNVWPALRRAKVTSEAISDVLPGLARPPGLQDANLESIERLKTWDIPDRDVSLQDQACAALFAFNVIEFDFPRPIGTQDAADALAAPLFSAAKTCRWIANEAPSPSPKEKSALETAAAYIENWAAWQLKHLLDSPYVIGKRSSGDDKIRARVRALATATHRIFGSFLYGTVATVATVALQPETTLTPRTVRNWCADLARPSKTPA